jgi:hypothetical protein
MTGPKPATAAVAASIEDLMKFILLSLMMKVFDCVTSYFV